MLFSQRTSETIKNALDNLGWQAPSVNQELNILFLLVFLPGLAAL
jgi:hypothetical protein